MWRLRNFITVEGLRILFFPACRICTPMFVLGTYIGKQSEREP
jgi:hypothetical protein